MIRCIIIFIACLCVSTAFGQETKIECVDGICTKWIAQETMNEVDVATMISDLDSDIAFLNNLPSGISVDKCGIVREVIHIMERDRVNWDVAKQTMINQLTERKAALENKTSQP